VAVEPVWSDQAIVAAVQLPSLKIDCSPIIAHRLLCADTLQIRQNLPSSSKRVKLSGVEILCDVHIYLRAQSDYTFCWLQAGVGRGWESGMSWQQHTILRAVGWLNALTDRSRMLSGPLAKPAGKQSFISFPDAPGRQNLPGLPWAWELTRAWQAVRLTGLPRDNMWSRDYLRSVSVLFVSCKRQYWTLQQGKKSLLFDSCSHRYGIYFDYLIFMHIEIKGELLTHFLESADECILKIHFSEIS
jgi:hypothetical protein